MSVILIINQSTTILDDPGLDRDVMNECSSIESWRGRLSLGLNVWPNNYWRMSGLLILD